MSNIFTAFIYDQKTRIARVGDTFALIGSNFAAGKLFEGVPVAAKYEGTVLGNIATNITKPAAIAVLPAVAASIAVPAVAITAGSTIIKTAIKAPLQTGVGVFAAATILQSPKATQAVIDLPKKAASASSDLAAFIEDPSIAAGTRFLKEHPEFAAAGVIAAGAGITSIAGAYANWANTQAIKNNTAATLKALEDQAAAAAKEQITAAERLVASQRAAAAAAAASSSSIVPTSPQAAFTEKAAATVVSAAPLKVPAATKKKKKAAPKKKKKRRVVTHSKKKQVIVKYSKKKKKVTKKKKKAKR